MRDAVELRVPTEEDAATWTALFDDAEVMRFIGNGERRDRAYYVGLVERQRSLAADSGLCLFSVLVEGRVAGFAGVHPWSHDWGRPVCRRSAGGWAGPSGDAGTPRTRPEPSWNGPVRRRFRG